MSEEFEDREQAMEVIHKRVGEWIDNFLQSPQYKALTDVQKDKAAGIITAFTDHAYRHIGMSPEQWGHSTLIECCVELLPRKVTAELAFFKAVSPGALRLF